MASCAYPSRLAGPNPVQQTAGRPTTSETAAPTNPAPREVAMAMTRRQVTGELGLLGVLGMLAVFDNVTGPDLAISIFYVMPIAAAAWSLSRPVAWANAALAALATYAADVLVGHRMDAAIAGWNVLFRGLLFGLVVELVWRLQREFRERSRLIGELQHALAEIRTLSTLLPMCAWCGQVRDDTGYWQKLEAYLHDQTGTRVSHGICPNCATKLEAEEGSGPAP